MFKCELCGKKVPDNGMKLFITYDIIDVACLGRKKHRNDYVSRGTATRQIRLCEKCRKENSIDISLD